MWQWLDDTREDGMMDNEYFLFGFFGNPFFPRCFVVG